MHLDETIENERIDNKSIDKKSINDDSVGESVNESDDNESVGYRSVDEEKTYDETIDEYVKQYPSKKITLDKHKDLKFNELNFEFGVINFEKNNQSGGNFNKLKNCIGKKTKENDVLFSLYTEKQKFNFAINNKNNICDQMSIKNEIINTFMYGKGSSNIVYNVTLIDEETKNNENNDYILKITTDDENYEIISGKYHQDKILIKDICNEIKDSVYKTVSPLIEMYAYGIVSFNLKKCRNISAYFSITKKYKNNKYIDDLDFEQKIFAFNNLVMLSKEFYKNSIVIYDLKAANIAYEMTPIGGKLMPVIVIIDYDVKLFQYVDYFYIGGLPDPKSSNLIMKYIDPGKLGTFIPYHIYCKNIMVGHLSKIPPLNLSINDLLFNSLGGLLEIFGYFFVGSVKLYNYLIRCMKWKYFEVFQMLVEIKNDYYDLILNTYKNSIYMLLSSFKNNLIGNYIQNYIIENTDEIINNAGINVKRYDSTHFDKLTIIDGPFKTLLTKNYNNEFKDWRKIITAFNVSINDEEYVKKIESLFKVSINIDECVIKNKLFFEKNRIYFNSMQISLSPGPKFNRLLFLNDDFYFEMLESTVDMVMNEISGNFDYENELLLYIFIQFCNDYNMYVDKLKKSSKLKKKYLLIKNS